MGLREVEFILGSNETISTRVLVDESSTVFEAMTQSGLLPRDGSLRYAIDARGNSLNHQTIQNAPNKIRMGMLKNIESIWGEANGKGPFVSSESLSGGHLLIPGIEVGEYANVFVTKREHNGFSYAYRFRMNNAPYLDGDLVFARAPLKGNNILLFNPKTGRECIRVPYQHPNLDHIRGFWGCCEIQTVAGNKIAVFRPDLTPVPKTFKPQSKPQSKPKNKPKNSHSAKKNKLVPCKLKKQASVQAGQSIFKGSVRQPAGGWQRALITGRLPKKGTTCDGVLVRLARKNSPALVNLPHYHDGQYIFMKLPETGDSTKIYNIDHPDSPIKILFVIQPGFSIDRKGQWVVAKFARNAANKRVLIVEGSPKDHQRCQI